MEKGLSEGKAGGGGQGQSVEGQVRPPSSVCGFMDSYCVNSLCPHSDPEGNQHND